MRAVSIVAVLFVAITAAAQDHVKFDPADLNSPAKLKGKYDGKMVELVGRTINGTRFENGQHVADFSVTADNRPQFKLFLNRQQMPGFLGRREGPSKALLRVVGKCVVEQPVIRIENAGVGSAPKPSP